MAFYLLKTEPGEYSFEDLQRDGRVVWEGVTNNAALMHLRTMKKGDLCFIYHSGSEKSVVGVSRVTRGPYQDPKHDDPKLVVVDLAPVEKLTRPVSLSQIKSMKAMRDFALVRISRLSVMPVPLGVWNLIMKLSEKP